MPQDLLERLASMQSGPLSKGQRRITQYLLAHYDKAAFMTAQRLGESAGVSESTVVRFACLAGFPGYPQLQRALQELVRNRLTSAQRMEVSSAQLASEDILQKVCALEMERVRCTMQDVDRAAFSQAVDAIAAADMLYIQGSRSAAALAQSLHFYFNHVFKNPCLVSTSGAGDMFEQICHIDQGDVFISLTFPRYSQRTLKAARYAKSRGACVIGITDSPRSPLAPCCDHLLCANSGMLSFVDSLVAPMCLINALLVAVGARKKEEALDSYRRLERLWEEYDVYDKPEMYRHSPKG